MSMTDEEHRHDLIEALRAVIGHQQTGTLMGYLPPVGWADVATKQDLAHQDALLRAETGSLRTEMTSEFAAVRSEMAGEFAAVRGEMGSLELRIEARMQEMFRKQTITLMSLMTALMTAYVAATSLL